jgi:hypothetical protein
MRAEHTGRFINIVLVAVCKGCEEEDTVERASLQRELKINLPHTSSKFTREFSCESEPIKVEHLLEKFPRSLH